MTHEFASGHSLLLWAAGAPELLPPEAVALIESEENSLHFSAASLWEITIKNDLGRPDFKVDPPPVSSWSD